MAGPNSVPNGDTRLMMGHVNTVYLCDKHGDKELDKCEERLTREKNPCKMITLREYLAARKRLITGKTR
jgi:hypothetical protein